MKHKIEIEGRHSLERAFEEAVSVARYKGLDERDEDWIPVYTDVQVNLVNMYQRISIVDRDYDQDQSPVYVFEAAYTR